MTVREYQAGRALCMCSCGEPAPLARDTDSRFGWVKDRPVRFIRGHCKAKGRDWFTEDPATHCWTAKKTRPDGYAYIHFENRRWLAHRLMYEAEVGPVPDGLELDHLCRNRACANPGHLEAVTHLENMRRGRGVLLTPSQVAEIRQRFAGWHGNVYAFGCQVGPEYGVSHGCIRNVVIGRTWAQEAA